MTPDEGYAEAVRRCVAAREAGATTLDLGDLPLHELPPELGTVRSLRTMALGVAAPGPPGNEQSWQLGFGRTTQKFEDLSILECLTELTGLSLSGCQRLTSVEPVGRLAQLTTLDLSGCGRLTSVEPVGRLARITKLDLSVCVGLTSVEPVGRLAQLTTLSLSYCRGLTTIRPVGRLARLTTLSLSGCEGLTSVEPVGRLARLTKLDLSGCEGLTSVEPISRLARLTTLSLSWCRGLTSVEPVGRLAALKYLDLSYCRGLSSVEPVGRLAQLTTLDLSGCEGLTSVEPVGRLAALTKLNLIMCRGFLFAPLRRLLGQLVELTLGGAKLDDLDAAVCGRSYSANRIAAVIAYFADLDQGSVPNSEVKLYVLGNGGVGKTQLARRLRDKPFNPSEPSTHGVRLHDVPLAGGAGQTLQLCLWDFGGQDVYHGTHALFLRPPAVFAVLWTPDGEAARPRPQAGLDIRDRPLDYWLDLLRATAGHDGTVDSPLLLVQSQCERKEDEQKPDPAPTDGFTCLYDGIKFAAANDRGLAGLKENLAEAAKAVFARTRPLIPAAWDQVRKAIRQLQDVPADNPDRKRFLAPGEFDRLCEGLSIHDTGVLLDWLSDTGVVFHRRDLFDGCVIVDQGWALEAVYTIFQRDDGWLRHFRDVRRGRFTRDELNERVWRPARLAEGKPAYTPDEQRLFVSYMEECHVSFRERELPGGDWEYAAPEFLPPADHFQAEDFDRPGFAEVRFEYDLLHDGAARRLLAELGGRGRAGPVYWRYGCRFRDADTGATAAVWCVPGRFGKDGPLAGTIRLRAWGDRAADTLDRLAGLLRRPAVGRPPREVGTDARRPPAEPTRAAVNTTAPPPLQTVFVSHKHTDAARLSLVRELVEALEADGWAVVWDEGKLQADGSVSDFAERARTCDYLVPVLCDRFHQSRWCLSEVDAFYKERKSLPERYADRAVPYVLDTRFDDDAGRRDLATIVHERNDGFLEHQNLKRASAADIEAAQRLCGLAHGYADLLRVLSDRVRKDDGGRTVAVDVAPARVVAVLGRRFRAAGGQQRAPRT